MAVRIITPEQQVANLREALWTREYELEHRGIPARELMSLVNAAIRLHEFEARVARGEAPGLEIHQCDDACERDERGWCPEDPD